jgi:hypothetical protein
MFVVILTGEAGQVITAPRAVGPFDSFDAAQKFRNDLVAQWAAEAGDAQPAAAVTRVEEPLPGVVVGEI